MQVHHAVELLTSSEVQNFNQTHSNESTKKKNRNEFVKAAKTLICQIIILFFRIQIISKKFLKNNNILIIKINKISLQFVKFRLTKESKEYK